MLFGQDWCNQPTRNTAVFVSLAMFYVLHGQKTEADDALAPLDAGTVQVGGEIGRRIDITIRNNLLKAKVDEEFLAPFQRRTNTSGYIGLGKLIDATVHFAVYSKNDQVIALKEHLVSSVIKAQNGDGYIGMMAEGSRIHGMWDVHEMAYLIFALTNDYAHFKQPQSLEAAQKAADYILDHWSDLPDNWDQQTGVATHVSVTGLERSMLNLARITGEQRYADFVVKQRSLPSWNLDLVIGRRPLIKGHIYAYLCRCLAQLELYRDRPIAQLLEPTTKVIQFQTRGDGMTITGGCGQWEIWTDDQDGREALGETCATAYQVRVLDSLLRLSGDSCYGDLMERAIYNALFAAQSPDGRFIRYYCPLEDKRVYHPGDTYCCPCNYRRIVAELPGMVYYRTQGGIAINLYTPSTTSVSLTDDVKVTLRQETDYPNSGKVTIHVSPTKNVRFPLQLRIPTWCKTARASVNNELSFAPTGGSPFLIDRTWKAGDRVVLEMPMPWRFVRGRKRQSGRVAVMRGPLVYCLAPQQDKSLESKDGADLGRLVLDPQTVTGPVQDTSVRPDGTACSIQAWKSGYTVARPAPMKLRFTEFPDPNGMATYFRLWDMNAAVGDELLTAPPK